MTANHKLDPKRLDHLERIASNLSGAAQKAGDRTNDINTDRNTARAELQRLEESAPRGASPDVRAQWDHAIAEARLKFDDLEKRLADARAEQQELSDRWTAAGNLARRCREHAAAHGLADRPDNKVFHVAR